MPLFFFMYCVRNGRKTHINQVFIQHLHSNVLITGHSAHFVFVLLSSVFIKCLAFHVCLLSLLWYFVFLHLVQTIMHCQHQDTSPLCVCYKVLLLCERVAKSHPHHFTPWDLISEKIQTVVWRETSYFLALFNLYCQSQI